MANLSEDIKTMKLYHRPDRVYNELKALGIKENEPLTVDKLAQFDQYHYLGTEAVDDAINALRITPDTRLIEVGSGIGGPARYLSHKTKCHVTAIELQPELHEIACSLTMRCGLRNRVWHICGDFLGYPFEHDTFDCVVSWLSFLHIPDRKRLLGKCHEVLNPAGQIFIEDFYKKGDFPQEETTILSRDVYCSYLPTLDVYQGQLAASGFTEISVTDMSDVWSLFVEERAAKFKENFQRSISVHEKMLQLFSGGNLGGVRIAARVD